MEFYSNCCDAPPTTDVYEEKDKILGYCSECKDGAVFFKQKEEDCYACATQRDKCEHDFSDDSLGDYPCSEDDSQDYPEDWKDV